MAMIMCPECGKEISDKAKRCPSCGFKIKNRRKKIVFLLGVIIIILIVLILGGLLIRNYNNNNDTQNEKETTIEKTDSTSDTKETEGFEEDKKQSETITKNKLVTVDGNCEFKITGYTIDAIIEPPAPDDYYTYFEAEAGNVFVDIKMNIKNLSTASVSQDEILDYVKLYYDNNYEYYCSFVTEENNGGNFNQYTTLYSIDPLQTMSYHMIASVPEEVKNNSKRLQVVISVDGQEYKCILR